MIYPDLIKNKTIFNQFNKIIKSNAIPNAFLFYGNQGVGKFAHSIEIAASLLCKNLINYSSCSECISCKKIKNNQHENIKYILPETQKNKTNPSLNDNNSMLTQKLSNPYYDTMENKSSSISINTIRKIRKKISLGTLDDSWMIHIIINAEKLCYPRQEAANALLKMLEEPHEKNLFILCTSNISQILDTISSRCLKLYFSNLANQSIEDYLIQTHKLSSEKAKTISNISNGNMILANRINKIYDVLFTDLSNGIKIILQNNIHEWINLVGKFPNKNYNFILILNMLELFFSDIITLQKTNIEDNIRFKLFIIEMKEYINKYNNANWNKCINTINNCKININKNSSLNSTLISLLFELNKNFSKDNFVLDELENYYL